MWKVTEMLASLVLFSVATFLTELPVFYVPCYHYLFKNGILKVIFKILIFTKTHIWYRYNYETMVQFYVLVTIHFEIYPNLYPMWDSSFNGRTKISNKGEHVVQENICKV